MKHVFKAVSISAAGLVVAGALTLGIAYGFVSGLLEPVNDGVDLTTNYEEED